MKRLIIVVAIGVLLVIIGLMFWHVKKHPSDASIRRELPGTWVLKSGVSTCTRYADGHFVTQLAGKRVGKLEGTWRIENGCLIETYTNSSFTKRVPYTTSTRILHMDSQELAVQDSGYPVSVFQKVQP